MIMAIVAFLLGNILCLLFGIPYIDFLKRHLFKQSIKDVAPKTHVEKEGTPTTGGIFIIFAVILSSVITLMMAQKMANIAYIILLTLTFYTIAGFQDDYLKIKGKSNDGLSARGKLVRQILIALLPTIFVMMKGQTAVTLGHHSFELGWFYPLLAIFIITGASNAYNLTDGLDGLAASSGFPTFIAIAIIATFSGYPQITIISSATAGALLGFLKYNKPKAEVFMGDTGSLAIGGLLGTLAIVGKFEILLAVLAALFVSETLSVIIQVASFKLTGKRVFKMAPIHHHFELLGWSEKKIVFSFAMTSAIFALLALIAYYVLYLK